jgi:aquaporin Z
MEPRKLVVEFIGTFFLFLTIGMVALPAAIPPRTVNEDTPSILEAVQAITPPLAIGSVLMVMVFAGGHISGAHYNPAVTLAVWLRGRSSAIEAPAYMASQVVAALAAVIVLLNFRGTPGVARVIAEDQILRVLGAEFLFTFALAYVVLNVATAKANAGNSFYGLAIGFTVLAGAYVMGPISMAVFNPAVAIGLCVVYALAWESLWIYLVATFVGAALAAVVFRALNPQDP